MHLTLVVEQRDTRHLQDVFRFTHLFAKDVGVEFDASTTFSILAGIVIVLGYFSVSVDLRCLRWIPILGDTIQLPIIP